MEDGFGLATAWGLPTAPVAVLCPPPSPSREPAPAPRSVPAGLQVVVYQPKVIGVVFYIFFLVSRFFLNKVFF